MYLLLGDEVVEGVDEAPVEVALARQRAVVHVSLLRVVVRPLQKSVKLIPCFIESSTFQTLSNLQPTGWFIRLYTTYC